ncbi:hypothetical protein [Mariniflexile sp. HMF6888]|uniref:hypothetical protein n=1 Tax=Mariniflexile sp. HMF6888 TaxID=3373086 RepID=UPI0037B276AB
MKRTLRIIESNYSIRYGFHHKTLPTAIYCFGMIPAADPKPEIDKFIDGPTPPDKL